MKEKKVVMYSDLNEVDQLKIRGLCILVIAIAIMLALKFVMVTGVINSLGLFFLTIMVAVIGGSGIQQYIEFLGKEDTKEEEV